MINTLEHKDVQAQRLNQMQQLIQQKQLQGYGTQLLRGTTNEAMTRHSLGTTNALTKRVYESNPQVQRILISVANKVFRTIFFLIIAVLVLSFLPLFLSLHV